MLLSEIQRSIITRITDARVPDVFFKEQLTGDYERKNRMFSVVSIRPMDGRERVYCDSVLKSGFILANVFAPDGAGIDEPTKLAEKFLEIFPEELEFDGISIPNLGDIKGALPDDKPGWFYVSTLIYFEAK